MNFSNLYQNKQHKVREIVGSRNDEECSCGWKGYGTASNPAARDTHFRIVQDQGGKLVKQMIYLASPHTHTNSGIRDDRYKAALECASYFIERGFWMFSPIVHSHNLPMNQYEHTVTWEVWQDFDTETITRMDEVWVLMIPGTSESKGVRAEIEIAKLQGRKIFTVWPMVYGGVKGDWRYEVFPFVEEDFKPEMINRKAITTTNVKAV